GPRVLRDELSDALAEVAVIVDEVAPRAVCGVIGQAEVRESDDLRGPGPAGVTPRRPNPLRERPPTLRGRSADRPADPPLHGAFDGLVAHPADEDRDALAVHGSRTHRAEGSGHELAAPGPMDQLQVVVPPLSASGEVQ